MSQEQPVRQEQASENEKTKEISLQEKKIDTDPVHGQVKQISNRLEVAENQNEPVPLSPSSCFDHLNITIGEALEATVLTSGRRSVDFGDAAAIQAAEVRATGRTNIVPGGVAAAAQSAATRNARITKEEEKTKLADILSGATSKLPSDKTVTRKDAEGVIGAELRNDPNLSTRPGGVAACIAAAARQNQNKHLK